MLKIAVVVAVMAVATAAPGFVGTGSFSHGPALFPGHVGYAAGPAIVKGPSYGAYPVAPLAYSSPAIVKSAVIAPAPVAVVKTPLIGSYGYGGHLGGYGAGFGSYGGHLGGYAAHLGGYNGHLGGFGGHLIH